MDKMIERTIENLKKNNMEAYFVETKEEARELVRSMLKKGEKVACGGSMSLVESGVRELLKSGEYDFHDRSEAKTPEELTALYRSGFSCDTYLTSANAVTEEGELINVDGNGNRVAAIVYGPASIICLVGKNKLVKNSLDGLRRVKEIAAPLNAKRLGCATPCAKTGVCCKVDGLPGDGCSLPERICAHYLVSGRQRIKNRIKVIITNESLGY